MATVDDGLGAKMADRSYSRPFYDANGFYNKSFAGEALNMSDMEFAIFMAKLAAEREHMAGRREAFLTAKAERLAELDSKNNIVLRWINPDDHWD